MYYLFLATPITATGPTNVPTATIAAACLLPRTGTPLSTAVFYALVAAVLIAAVLCLQEVNTDWMER